MKFLFKPKSLFVKLFYKFLPLNFQIFLDVLKIKYRELLDRGKRAISDILLLDRHF